MKKEETKQYLEKVLKGSYKSFFVDSISVREIYPFSETKCSLELSVNGDTLTLEGKGKGVVDSIFNALFHEFSKKYKSLAKIKLDEFWIKAKVKNENSSGLDSQVEVSTRFLSPNRFCIEITEHSRSLVEASLQCILNAVELFVNGELAYKVIKNSLEDAKSRGREDLVTRYTSELADIVKLTDYDKI